MQAVVEDFEHLHQSGKFRLSARAASTNASLNVDMDFTGDNAAVAKVKFSAGKKSETLEMPRDRGDRRAFYASVENFPAALREKIEELGVRDGRNDAHQVLRDHVEAFNMLDRVFKAE